MLVHKPMRRAKRIEKGNSELLERMIRANIRDSGLHVIWEIYVVSLGLHFPEIHLILWLVQRHSSRASVMT